MTLRTTRALWVLALVVASVGAAAVPIEPLDDREVIEQLPGGSGDRAEARRLRRALAERPGDVALAVAVARRGLEQARADGDPRHAGRAAAALSHWVDPASAPDEVLLLQATLDQYLHDFDAAAAKLERLVGRRPRDAQAWLTLATVRRVQGRYGESDLACARVLAAGALLHGRACRAENDGLRGHFASARDALDMLLSTHGLDAETRNWLWTTLAELEQRAGEPSAAETAWHNALAAQASPYAVLGLADHLIARQRPVEALALLAGQTSSDAVVLRRAIAGVASGAPQAQADVREMHERITLANERPGAMVFHGREQAMFALAVERRADRAWALARENVRHQREAQDLLLLAEVAQAVGAAAPSEAARVYAEVGLVDRRREGGQ